MRGVTLVELLAALTLLGVLVSLAGVTVASLRPPPEAELLHTLRAARHDAIVNGTPVLWGQDTVTVRFLPDGSSSGGTFALEGLQVSVDPVTGAIHATE